MNPPDDRQAGEDATEHRPLMFALFRRRWAAVLVVGVVVMMMMFSDLSHGPVYQLTAGLAISAILMSVLLRSGLLATVA